MSTVSVTRSGGDEVLPFWRKGQKRLDMEFKDDGSGAIVVRGVNPEASAHTFDAHIRKGSESEAAFIDLVKGEVAGTPIAGRIVTPVDGTVVVLPEPGPRMFSVKFRQVPRNRGSGGGPGGPTVTNGARDTDGDPPGGRLDRDPWPLRPIEIAPSSMSKTEAHRGSGSSGGAGSTQGVELGKAVATREKK